jgi:hypothetical protein
MSEALLLALLLALALAASALGMAWLALAMDVHWAQLRGAQPLRAGTQRALRGAGALALVASFGFCLRADHATMAVLVWVMSLAAGALAVAFALAWRPHWLAPLLAWAPRPTLENRS